MKKNKAPTTRRGHEQSLNNTSRDAQRQRLLKALRGQYSTGITTFECQSALNICAPAARVHELRHDYGYNIKTVPATDRSASGLPHRCAMYVLMPGKFKGVK